MKKIRETLVQLDDFNRDVLEEKKEFEVKVLEKRLKGYT